LGVHLSWYKGHPIKNTPVGYEPPFWLFTSKGQPKEHTCWVVFQEFGPMVLASGGFGADFGSDSLLATYRPDLLHLPTTNGEHCTGLRLQSLDL
jgi:hypothetical protein